MSLTQTIESKFQPTPDSIDTFLAEIPIFEVVSDRDITTRLQVGVACIAGANVPYKIEIPEELKDPVPSLLAPGYLGIEEAYEELRHEIALRGKPAISYSPPRAQSPRHALHPSHLLHPEKLPSQANWGVMRDVMRRKDLALSVDKFDLEMHSMAGLTGSEAALEKHEYVRHAVFIGSVGLTGHTRKELFGKFFHFINNDIPEMVSELRFDNNLRAALHVVDYIWRNPTRTLMEGWAVGGCDIRESVRHLGNLGIKTAVLASVQDPLFDVDKVRENTDGVVDMFVEYGDPHAGHNIPQLNPHRVARFLDQIHKYLAEI